MTVGQEPKPIRTGATLHSICVTHGPLKTFKLFVRAYDGASDMDLDVVHKNVQNTQKWVKLYDIMLDQFKGEGRCVTMDLAYMGLSNPKWYLDSTYLTQHTPNQKFPHLSIPGVFTLCYRVPTSFLNQCQNIAQI